MGGGPSGDPFWGGGPATDCAIAAPDAQAIHSRLARASPRAVRPWPMLVVLDNVLALSRRGSDA